MPMEAVQMILLRSCTDGWKGEVYGHTGGLGGSFPGVRSWHCKVSSSLLNCVTG